MMKKNYEKNWTDLKCGWQFVLDSAWGDLEGTNSIGNDMKHYYNPYKYYLVLKKNFEEVTEKMKNIINKGINPENISELINLDIVLSKIVFSYEFDEGDWSCLSETDEDTFEDKLKAEFNDVDDYFRFPDDRKLFVSKID